MTNKSMIKALLNDAPVVPCEIRIIHLSNGESYKARISRVDDQSHHTCYKVEVDRAISTGEENPTYSWILPSENTDEAAERFVDRIEEIREGYSYYEPSHYK